MEKVSLADRPEVSVAVTRIWVLLLVTGVVPDRVLVLAL
jgi:hypothetical protein